VTIGAVGGLNFSVNGQMVLQREMFQFEKLITDN
jgi:hypothetical protein